MARVQCICLRCGESFGARPADIAVGKGKYCSLLCFRGSNATHRMSGTPEYNAWRSMKVRCLNPSNEGYALYGGRGITIYGPWQESFEAFFAHIGRRPSAQHSLDRIDNDGNYEPGNVRWATPREQMNNRNVNRSITYKDETHTVAEWARLRGMSKTLLLYRLNQGWTPERILSDRVGRWAHSA